MKLGSTPREKCRGFRGRLSPFRVCDVQSASGWMVSVGRGSIEARRIFFFESVLSDSHRLRVSIDGLVGRRLKLFEVERIKRCTLQGDTMLHFSTDKTGH